jgi:sugar/nucleoside kinase (ribokinase family)
MSTRSVKASSILVVGSVALDSVETAKGRVERALGGSSVYLSLSAVNFAPVSVVGVVGEDFPGEHRRLLEKRGVDISGLKTLPGKTFHWQGSYTRDFRSAITKKTELNVFEKFRPELSDAECRADILFLANIDPELQLNVLSQMRRPRLVACDTMNFWIERKRPQLLKLLKKVDFIFVNEDEARQLTGEHSLILAGQNMLRLGPRAVLIKKGDYGASLFACGKMAGLCAYPVRDVVDTTGAGDTFGGGFMGYIANSRRPHDFEELKKAMAWGTVMSSFKVEAFSVKRLASLKRPEIMRRWKEYISLVTVRS